MADDATEFTARQEAHARQVHLERDLMRTSGKSLSEVRRSLRQESESDRFAQLAAADSALGRGDRIEPQRPSPPALQITTVELPRRQIINLRQVEPGDPPPPASIPSNATVDLDVCELVEGVLTVNTYSFLIQS